jgi:hypothetical protein
MTAAGLALIAGGLATLISFRAVLFGGGRGARRRQARALEAPRRRPALTATPEPVEEPADEMAHEPAEVVAYEPAEVVAYEPAEPAALSAAEPEIVRPRRSRRSGRRRSLVAAAEVAESEWSDPDEGGGLASIGLADEEVEEAEVAEAAVVEDEIPEPVVVQRDDHYGDRVDGWVRPEYHDIPAEEPRPGEYWTPIPVDLAGDAEPSAKGYGWPRPVERLPAVPDYEPATGFDLVPVVSEPTEVVPAWPLNDDRPGRIRLPRSWSARNDKPAGKLEQPADRRPRPRPRPRPEPPVDNSTVYVSRHAADPPPRRDQPHRD